MTFVIVQPPICSLNRVEMGLKYEDRRVDKSRSGLKKRLSLDLHLASAYCSGKLKGGGNNKTEEADLVVVGGADRKEIGNRR